MPTYEYHCPANDQVVTVVHRMVEDLHTWGRRRATSECAVHHVEICKLSVTAAKRSGERADRLEA